MFLVESTMLNKISILNKTPSKLKLTHLFRISLQQQLITNKKKKTGEIYNRVLIAYMQDNNAATHTTSKIALKKST